MLCAPVKNLLLTLLALTTAAATALVQGAEADDLYTLQIRPSICVSYNSEEPCTMLLHISWQGASRQAVCLKTSTEAVFIRCWDGVLSGSMELPWENSGDVVYQLVSMQNNRVLADAEVLVINRDLRDSRRRRRHVWSIL